MITDDDIQIIEEERIVIVIDDDSDKEHNKTENEQKSDKLKPEIPKNEHAAPKTGPIVRKEYTNEPLTCANKQKKMIDVLKALKEYDPANRIKVELWEKLNLLGQSARCSLPVETLQTDDSDHLCKILKIVVPKHWSRMHVRMLLILKTTFDPNKSYLAEKFPAPAKGKVRSHSWTATCLLRFGSHAECRQVHDQLKLLKLYGIGTCVTWDIGYVAAIQAGLFRPPVKPTPPLVKATTTSSVKSTPTPTGKPTQRPTPTPPIKASASSAGRHTPLPPRKPAPAPSVKPTPPPSVKASASSPVRPTPPQLGKTTPDLSVKPTLLPPGKPTPAPTERPTPPPSVKASASSPVRPTPLQLGKTTPDLSVKPTLLPPGKPTPAPTERPTPPPSVKASASSPVRPTPLQLGKTTPDLSVKPTLPPPGKPTPAPTERPMPPPSVKASASSTVRPTPPQLGKTTPDLSVKPTLFPPGKPTPAPRERPMPPPSVKASASSPVRPTPPQLGKTTPDLSVKPTLLPPGKPTPAPTERPTPPPSVKASASSPVRPTPLQLGKTTPALSVRPSPADVSDLQENTTRKYYVCVPELPSKQKCKKKYTNYFTQPFTATKVLNKLYNEEDVYKDVSSLTNTEEKREIVKPDANRNYVEVKEQSESHDITVVKVEAVEVLNIDNITTQVSDKEENQAKHVVKTSDACVTDIKEEGVLNGNTNQDVFKETANSPNQKTDEVNVLIHSDVDDTKEGKQEGEQVVNINPISNEEAAKTQCVPKQKKGEVYVAEHIAKVNEEGDRKTIGSELVTNTKRTEEHAINSNQFELKEEANTLSVSKQITDIGNVDEVVVIVKEAERKETIEREKDKENVDVANLNQVAIDAANVLSTITTPEDVSNANGIVNKNVTYTTVGKKDQVVANLKQMSIKAADILLTTMTKEHIAKANEIVDKETTSSEHVANLNQVVIDKETDTLFTAMATEHAANANVVHKETIYSDSVAHTKQNEDKEACKQMADEKNANINVAEKGRKETEICEKTKENEENMAEHVPSAKDKGERQARAKRIHDEGPREHQTGPPNKKGRYKQRKRKLSLKSTCKLKDVNENLNSTYGLKRSFLKKLGITQLALSNTVLVGNLPAEATSVMLYDIFALAGNIKNLEFSKHLQREAIVMYEHPVEAVQAISMFNNQLILDQQISVKMETKEERSLPPGLKSIGPGLGLQGRPLSGVTAFVELQKVQKTLTDFGLLKGESSPTNPFIAHSYKLNLKTKTESRHVQTDTQINPHSNMAVEITSGSTNTELNNNTSLNVHSRKRKADDHITVLNSILIRHGLLAPNTKCADMRDIANALVEHSQHKRRRISSSDNQQKGKETNNDNARQNTNTSAIAQYNSIDLTADSADTENKSKENNLKVEIHESSNITLVSPNTPTVPMEEKTSNKSTAVIQDCIDITNDSDIADISEQNDSNMRPQTPYPQTLAPIVPTIVLDKPIIEPNVHTTVPSSPPSNNKPSMISNSTAGETDKSTTAPNKPTIVEVILNLVRSVSQPAVEPNKIALPPYEATVRNESQRQNRMNTHTIESNKLPNETTVKNKSELENHTDTPAIAPNKIPITVIPNETSVQNESKRQKCLNIPAFGDLRNLLSRQNNTNEIPRECPIVPFVQSNASASAEGPTQMIGNKQKIVTNKKKMVPNESMEPNVVPGKSSVIITQNKRIKPKKFSSVSAVLPSTSSERPVVDKWTAKPWTQANTVSQPERQVFLTMRPLVPEIPPLFPDIPPHFPVPPQFMFHNNLNKPAGNVPVMNNVFPNCQDMGFNHQNSGRSQKQSKKDINKPRLLIFTNLPPTVTIQALTAKMEEIGEVTYSEMTGPDAALLEYRQHRDAARCVRLYHRSKVDGQVIDVMFP